MNFFTSSLLTLSSSILLASYNKTYNKPLAYLTRTIFLSEKASLLLLTSDLVIQESTHQTIILLTKHASTSHIHASTIPFSLLNRSNPSLIQFRQTPKSNLLQLIHFSYTSTFFCYFNVFRAGA